MPGVNIKKDDNVRVMAGKDRGKEGRVVRVLPARGPRDGRRRGAGEEAPARDRGRARTSGQQLQQGGIIDVEMFIDISNVQIVCGSCGQPTRVGYRDRRGRHEGADLPQVRGRSCDGRRLHAAAEGAVPRRARARAEGGAGLRQRHAGAAPREDRRQHGRRRRRQGRSYARRRGRGPHGHHRAEAGGHARPASRSPGSSSARGCRSARRSRCAATGCGSSSTGSSSLALPRIRDFRGLNPTRSTGTGTTRSGVTEQLIFPEIDYDKVPKVRGMDITIVTTATDDDEGRALLVGARVSRSGAAGGRAGELRDEDEMAKKALINKQRRSRSSGCARTRAAAGAGGRARSTSGSCCAGSASASWRTRASCRG